MTMNDSWGYQRADDNWKSPKTSCAICCNARATGQLSAKYRPKARWLHSGRIGEDSDRVGKWMDTHAQLIHKADRAR